MSDNNRINELGELMINDNTQLTFGDLFVEHTDKSFNPKSGQMESQLVLDISEIGTAWLEQNDELVKSITLSFLPMVIPPMDWTHPAKFGGYFDPSINKTYTLIKGKSRKQIAKLYEEHPKGFKTLMKTINNLQKTPFRINQTIFEAVEWIHTKEINLDRAGIPTYVGGWDTMVGPEKAEEYFEIKRLLTKKDGRYTDESRTMLLDYVKTVIEGSKDMKDEDLWKEWSMLRKAVIKHSRGESSKRILIDNTLTDAGWFFNEDIYFSYNADYRGRIYPLAGQFSPQGSDVSRGMLEFANGKEMDVFEDTDAVKQIAIVCANNFGNDKVSLDDRAEWSEQHSFEMMECARDYQENTWWMKADKPFLFLLSCIEWTKVMDARLDDGKMITTLPIGFDGSCNGIQHFSALFLDPKGAEAVNLIDSDVPNDVYQIVADDAKAQATGTTNNAYNKILAFDKEFEGKLFGRKVAKRSTMCLPYGVSQRSSTKYVVETVDEVLRAKREEVKITGTDAKTVRATMGKLIWSAIGNVVEAPVVGKEFFQDVARCMARWEKGLMWFTPTGLPVVQSLKKRDVKPNVLRVTIDGKSVSRKYPKYTSEIDGSEQANAVSPNYVHSFDSAHLQFSINAAAMEGIEDFLVIHDSFATDALSAGRFNEIIREQFVKMYEGMDYLNKFYNDCEAQLEVEDGLVKQNDEGQEVPITRMVQGDFDITEVLTSKYFFS